MKPGPKMSREDSRRRVERAYRLRLAGRTWDEIAATEGFRSRSAVANAVKRYLDATPAEGVDQQRRTASDSLRLVKSILFGTMADAKRQGDHPAVISAARTLGDLIDKDAKLNGLHAPQRTEVNVHVEQTPAAIVERMRSELLAVAAQRQPQQALPGNVVDAEFEEIHR